jgi:hypothetical protein
MGKVIPLLLAYHELFIKSAFPAAAAAAELQQDEFPDYAGLHTQDSAKVKAGGGAVAVDRVGNETDALMGLINQQQVQPQHGDNGPGEGFAGGVGGHEAGMGGLQGALHGPNRSPFKPVSQQEVEGNVRGAGGLATGKGEAEDGVVKSQGLQQQEHVGGFGGRHGW